MNVCNTERTVTEEAPASKDKEVVPEPSKVFRPVFFVFGLFIVVGGGLFLYQKTAVSYLFPSYSIQTKQRREFLNEYFEKDLESKSWGTTKAYNDFGELNETTDSFYSHANRAKYFQSPEFYLQE